MNAIKALVRWCNIRVLATQTLPLNAMLARMVTALVYPIGYSIVNHSVI